MDKQVYLFCKGSSERRWKIFECSRNNQKYDIRVQFLDYLGCINVVRADSREYNWCTEHRHLKEQAKVYMISF